MIKYKALRKEVTKYWKTSYEPNGIAVGGTFDADRQTYIIPVGGKGHIETPDVPPLSTADYWEITVSFTYQGSAGSYPCLFGYSGGVDYKAPCLTYESGNYRLYLSFNGTGWDFVGNTGIAPQVGSTYKFNVRFTGVAYVVRCSVDGGSMTEVLRYSNSTPVHCSVPLWFMDLSLNNNYATYGELKLFNTSIFIDTDYWWEGVKEVKVPATPDDYDSTTVETEYKVAEETTTQYWKGNPEEVAANPDGLITSDTGGGGWTIYQQGPWYEVWLMLNSQASPSYPRWQTQGLGAVAYLKTPEEGILSKYLTTQWCDPGFDGRICNEWEIQGYKTEADMLSMTNGTVLDHNTWANRNRGESKIIRLDNNKSFQYYTIQMLGRFGSDSYNSMGTTKFYMKNMEPVEHPETYYWKREYGTEINGNKYGDGSYNTDTRVFSTRNGNWGYIVTEETPPLTYADSWEIGTKFVYQGGVSIIGSSGGMWTNPWLSVQNGRMTISLTTYGETLAEGSWIDPPYYPSAGDLYEIKIGFTGDLYYVDYRRNGEGDFIRGWSRSSTDKEVYNIEPLWFLHGPDNSGYRGYADLYLKDTYVTINGEEWWRGVDAITVPATPDDYDFTTTNYDFAIESRMYKALKEEVEYDPHWQQPILTSNDGDPRMQVTATELGEGTQAWHLFDGNPDTLWHSGRGYQQSVYISLADAICIQSLDITNRSDDPNNVYALQYITLKGSNDGGNTYTTIDKYNNSEKAPGATWTATFNNSNYYDHYELYLYAGSGVLYRALMEIKIHALK